jgi:hypothetical protein
VQPCATGAVDGSHERSHNFQKVIDTFFQGNPPVVSVFDTTPSHLILSPVIFTPEVDSNYGNSGSYLTSVPDGVGFITASTAASSTLAEPLGDIANNHVSPPVEPTTSYMVQGHTEGIFTADESYVESHDIQIPKPVTVYLCRDDINPHENSLPIDIPFQYEAFITHQANHGDAIQDLKRRILDDIGNSLGCAEASSRRLLRRTAEIGFVSGFQSTIDSNDLSNGKKNFIIISALFDSIIIDLSYN